MATDQEKNKTNGVKPQARTPAEQHAISKILKTALASGSLDHILDKILELLLPASRLDETTIEIEKELKHLVSFSAYNPNPILELSRYGKVLYLNDAARECFPDISRLALKHPLINKIEPLLESFAAGKQHGMTWEAEVGGAIYHQKAICLPEHESVRVYSWDITGIQGKTGQLEEQDRLDVLTGLYNRVEFELQLSQMVLGAQSNNKIHALMYFDLDQFKAVNDRCGHVAGNELLKQLANLLKDNVRDGDILARLGGDVFGLLLPDCPIDKAAEIAEKIRMLVEVFRFSWQNNSFDVGVSIGLVSIDTNHGNTDEIISAADAACYIAKDQGRNRVHIYSNKDISKAEKKGRMRWVPRLQQALNENTFQLFCQEITPLLDHDKKPFFETLIRYQDDDGNLVLPDAFLPEAERYNLSGAIDRWVVSNTFRHIIDRGLFDTNFTINLSGHSLSNWHFLNFIIDQFHDTEVDPGQICFDIDESVAIANLPYGTRFIATLRGMGCHFALDNFGIGLISFEYLKTLSVDYLKIRGGYINELLTNKVSAAMVESINNISHAMELQTIAERVEDEETLQRLREIGVDYAQGAVVSKPVPLDTL